MDTLPGWILCRSALDRADPGSDLTLCPKTEPHGCE